jgi:hypothetical protein
MNPKKLRPNGIVMGDCFAAELKNAKAERRSPSTSNVMALWNRTPNAQHLTPQQTEDVLNFVLKAVLEFTGATAVVWPNPN